MSIKTKGLVRRSGLDLLGNEKIDEVTVYNIPFDLVKFSHSADPYWFQRGSYEDREDFTGFEKKFDENKELVDKKGYYVCSSGMFFKDLNHYREFVNNNMREDILEEIWEDI